ncbi:glycoside hydrolase family 47 protein [Gymnopilus junonius]|uniref:alpha-1,2-Mannosidase n=1 Tax=Gymnopilus junonius TaxID=109634 RepID=A0A9P5NY34_GYMJU|nr:glycoside hydrolase family 47 protein [Gymnopilus junonius]
MSSQRPLESFEMHLRNILRLSRSRPLLRNVVYGFLTCLALYVLLYTTAPRRVLSSLPHYGQPNDVGQPTTWDGRAAKVREAFVHAYRGYMRYAAPSDELKPLSNGNVNNFNGWGVTAFDSLDTMLLMDLKHEYKHALGVVKQADFTKSEPLFVPFFETVIRYLGGLLSAYALSTDEIFLRRAEEMAKQLDPVFNSTTGLPYYSVNPKTGEHKGIEVGVLAEIASLQVEYTYLAKLTGKFEHFNRSQAIMKALGSADLKLTAGMLPIRWNLASGQISDYHLSVGAQADSAHEYLLKLYLLTGKTDRKSLEMYIQATTHIITDLLYLSPTRNLLYVTDSSTPTFERQTSPSHIFEHLSCFLPGLFALGAHTLPLDNLEALGLKLEDLGNEKSYGLGGKAYKKLKRYNLKDLHMWAAEGLAQTCWVTYADQPTGLGPDEMFMDVIMGKNTFAEPNEQSSAKHGTYLWMDAVEKWRSSGGRGIIPGLADPKPIIYSHGETSTGGQSRDYVIRKPGYLLRPETVESLYVLWKVTGDEKWRSRGWDIFEALERETKTSNGYASLQFVDRIPSQKVDSMPSYFLAETLKYLYLMFLEEDPISLDKWVFNTEAHPLPVFNWTAEERIRFNV